MAEILFDLEESNGEWFAFQMSTLDENHDPVFEPPMAGIEDGPSVCLRQPDGDFFDKLHKKTRKKIVEQVWHPKKHTPFRQETLVPKDDNAEKEEREALWDYCIVGFKNFKDQNGKVIECTKENKMKLMKASQPFMRFFNKGMKDLAASSGVIRKEEDENL